jgi:hypothetical protein
LQSRAWAVEPGWIHTFDQMADTFLGWPA